MSNHSTHHGPCQGSCLCGAIEVSAEFSTPAHACHCTMCRKHNGATFHSLHGTNFTVHKGNEFLAKYASSKWAHRGFCTQCGSSIFYSTNDEALRGVSLGILKNPKPPLAKHIYVDCAELRPDLTPDIWDDLPQMEAKEFLRSIGLEQLYDHHLPATAQPDTTEHYGGCSCGGVTFKTTLLPDAPIICHCGQCQKQTSSFFRSAAIDLAHFFLIKQDTLKWYRASTKARRGFCQNCGSLLFWQPLEFREREYMSILSGSFDARIPQIPAQHIFVEDAENTPFFDERC